MVREVKPNFYTAVNYPIVSQVSVLSRMGRHDVLTRPRVVTLMSISSISAPEGRRASLLSIGKEKAGVVDLFYPRRNNS